MAKVPEFRDQDEVPRRKEDLSIPVPWSDKPITVSGSNVSNLLLWIALLGGGVWHHDQSIKSDQKMRELTQHEFRVNRDVQMLQVSFQAQNICVLRLNEEQRQEDRQTGKYCPDTSEEIRRYIKYKEKEAQDATR